MSRRANFLVTAAALALGFSACAETDEPPPATPVAVAPTPAPAPTLAPAPVIEPIPQAVEPTYWKGRTDLLKPPAPPEPAELKLPPVERWKLKNGLDVIVVPRKGLPVASFSVAIKAGGYDEAADRILTATFTADMLRKGTKKRKADDISKAIDFVGGSLGTSATMEASGASCTSLSKDSKLCLDLLSDILLNPTFPEEEMGQVRDQLVAGIQGRYDNPSALAAEHFENLLFGDAHPDGRSPTPENAKSIKREHLVEFWKTFYRPNNAILAIAGDVDVAKLKNDLEAAFGPWEAAAVAARAEYRVPERKGTRVLLVDRDDLNQATLTFGHRGLRHADREWYAATMVNYVLGGSDFSARLMTEVRSKRGLTYGVYSSFGEPLFEGAFRITMSTKNATAWAALVASIDEMRRMKVEGPTAEELAKGRGYYAGSYPFRLQSAEAIAQSIVKAELHGLGIPYVRQLPVRLARVDTARAKQAAADWLDPDNLVIVIVGKAAEIEPQIVRAGLKYEKIGFKDPVSVAARKAERDRSATAATSGEGDKALAMVKRALDAHGGEKAWRALKDLTVVRAGTVKSQGSEVDVEVKSQTLQPGRVRVEQETMTPNGTKKMSFVMTPGGIFVDAGTGLKPVPGQFGAYLRRAVFADPNFILLRATDAGLLRSAQLVAPIDIGGKKFDGFTFKGPGGDPISLYFDAQTGLLTRMTFRGLKEASSETYADFRVVAGVKLPFKVAVEGEDAGEHTIKDIKANTGLDPKLFE